MNKISKETARNLLSKFLASNGIGAQYISNVTSQINYVSIFGSSNKEIAKKIIYKIVDSHASSNYRLHSLFGHSRTSFTWSETTEGFGYWQKMRNRWRIFLEKRNINTEWFIES